MKFRIWLIITVALFAVGFILGFVSPPGFNEVFQGEIEALQKLAGMLKPFTIQTAIYIYLRNCTALALSFLLSPILLLMPVITLLANGWLLAFVAVLAGKEQSILYVIVGVLPHGIIELPAFFLGQSAALSFGTMVLIALFNKKQRANLGAGFRRRTAMLAIALGLMMPAALIETYVTPLLLHFFFA